MAQPTEPLMKAWPLEGATSFEELEKLDGGDMDAIRRARLDDQFMMIANNIAYNPDLHLHKKRAYLHQLVSQYDLRSDQVETYAPPPATPNDENLLLPNVKARKRRVPKKRGNIRPEPSHPHTFCGFHSKAAIKREGGIDFPAKDYAFVPDPTKPTTWKIRLTESPGKVTVAQLGRAAAALSAGGFRGNRARIPDGVRSVAKRRIRAEYRRLGVAENMIPNSVKESDSERAEAAGKSFMLWKDGDGGYRWLAIYSNNYVDRDDPPEIISEQSHKAFVALVDAGLVDYPELWHWHIPGTAWGKADMLDYVDGFALASGYVYRGHEKEAESLMGREDLGVSHGMPYSTILREPADPGIIRFHITREISELPHWAAANPLTDFVVLREAKDMPINEKKRAFLRDRGLSDGYIDDIQSRILKTRAQAEEAGILSKENDEDEEDEEYAEEMADESDEEDFDGEGGEDATNDEGEDESDEDGDADEKAGARRKPSSFAGTRRKPRSRDDSMGKKPRSRDDGLGKKPSSFAGMRRKPKRKSAEKSVEKVVEFVTVDDLFEIVTPIFDQLAAYKLALGETLDIVKELAREDAERLTAVKEATPTRSLAAMLERANSIGQKATQVDGRTQLGKEGPEETDTPIPNFTPVPFLNGQIQRTQG